jgi:DNA-binding PadR family transcriptional regulator
VKLKSDEVMTIGYLKRKGIALSPLGQKYLEEIRKFEGM